MLMDKLLSQHSKLLQLAYGFECGPGWADILKDLFESIDEAGLSDRVVFTQIKEKFGLLRIYGSGFHSDDTEAAALVERAVERSRVTCESCGKPGELVQRSGWYRVSCAQCLERT